MSRTRIKICGITRPQDAQLAAELGADAIGLNFVGGPRMITLETGSTLIRTIQGVPLPPAAIALCGSPSGDMRSGPTAGEIGNELRITCFQVYGLSQAKLLNDDDWRPYRVDRPYWFVCPVSSRESITKTIVEVAVEKLHPQAILLDTASAEKLGGTGHAFNWNWIAEVRAAGELEGLPPIILAGGLTPENVAEAILIARPYAVDVSSGVEIAGKPGIKDPIKIRDFIQAVRM